MSRCPCNKARPVEEEYTRVERYDAKGNVCGNQDDFNTAFKTATVYTRNETMGGVAGAIFAVVWIVLLVWAVMLARKAPAQDRIEHIFFAIIGSPAYIIANYMGR